MRDLLVLSNDLQVRIWHGPLLLKGMAVCQHLKKTLGSAATEVELVCSRLPEDSDKVQRLLLRFTHALVNVSFSCREKCEEEDRKGIYTIYGLDTGDLSPSWLTRKQNELANYYTTVYEGVVSAYHSGWRGLHGLRLHLLSPTCERSGRLERLTQILLGAIGDMPSFAKLVVDNGMPCLRHRDISTYRIGTSPHGTSLVDGLEKHCLNHKSLAEVDVRVGMDRKYLAQMLNALQKTSGLRRLHLGDSTLKVHHNVVPKAVEDALAGVIRNNSTSLTDLGLECFTFSTPEHPHCVSDLLLNMQMSSQLRSLSLIDTVFSKDSRSDIVEQGFVEADGTAESIIGLVENNSKLQVLRLDYERYQNSSVCIMQDRSDIRLFSLIGSRLDLTALEISGCHITEPSKAFAAIQRCRNLQSLKVKDIPYIVDFNGTEEGPEELREWLEHNDIHFPPNLTNCWLDAWFLDGYCLQKVCQDLCRHSPLLAQLRLWSSVYRDPEDTGGISDDQVSEIMSNVTSMKGLIRLEVVATPDQYPAVISVRGYAIMLSKILTGRAPLKEVGIGAEVLGDQRDLLQSNSLPTLPTNMFTEALETAGIAVEIFA